MNDFDLRATVRAILDETDLTSPEEVTDKVIGTIPKEAVQSVLWMLLRDWVHVEFSRQRMKSVANNFNGTRPGPAPSSSGSAKVRAIRDAAPKWLRDRIWMGGVSYGLMADLTYDNLQFLQADREQSAARHLASADAFARLAVLVKKYKVARVGDLPLKVLAAFEWRAAA